MSCGVQFILALLPVTAVLLVPWWAPESSIAEWVKRLLSKNTPAIEALRSLGLPMLGVVLLGFGWFKAVRRLAMWIQNRLLATVNYDVLQPLEPPRALDPIWGGAVGQTETDWKPMPWQEVTRRQEEWQRLRHFVELGTGTGGTWLWARTRRSSTSVGEC